VMTILNGTSKAVDLPMSRYEELFSIANARDVMTGNYVSLNGKLHLKPRQSLILEY